ncbi:MAG: hypothetical protein ABIF01_03935, partial [Candidatus Micrarchaeota archaeon]
QGIPTTSPDEWFTYPTGGINVSAQQSATIGIPSANILDGAGAAQTFNEGDIYSGKCYVEFYYTKEGASATRRNIADMKTTAQP